MDDSGLAKRLGLPTEPKPRSFQHRDYVIVVIRTIDGEDIEGELSLPKAINDARVRPFDFLERGTEEFLRLKNASVRRGDATLRVGAVAVNKAAVVRMHEKGQERA